MCGALHVIIMNVDDIAVGTAELTTCDLIRVLDR